MLSLTPESGGVTVRAVKHDVDCGRVDIASRNPAGNSRFADKDRLGAGYVGIDLSGKRPRDVV
jgi:hypothetical protein